MKNGGKDSAVHQQQLVESSRHAGKGKGGVLPKEAWLRRWVKPVLCSGCGALPGAPPAPRSGSSRLLEAASAPPEGAKPRDELLLAGRGRGVAAPSSTWGSDPG